METIKIPDSILDLLNKELERVHKVLDMYHAMDTEEAYNFWKEEFLYWKQQRESLLTILMPKYIISNNLGSNEIEYTDGGIPFRRV